MSERDLFDAALAIDDPAQRAAYLDRVCAGDPALREHLDGLLSLHAQVGSFLEAPALAALATFAEPITERPGAVVGPYKLLEEIGEGGFGVVFMAEQTQPVRRKVALKVLKPGMGTRQVVARFEAERQALALMDHPHIAKVFDGGATASGRPYFVMELVRGIPITEYCDQAQLTPRERLELFVHLCQAVQHAHQKGIIHRDLKPSNVLVSVHDTTPVVKVIDFGVAKALGQELTDKTLYTGFAQMVGTPLYMSPEQAGMSGLDIDTRSDIYSLGVLLYELLTGTTPLDREQLKQAGYEEIRRLIREEDPARPSTRVSTPGQAARTASANRQSDPGRLSQLFRGELDWIVMKCLEKDRNRRYESASALAADVQRYLNDEPVSACPPSAWYRFRKFARRKKSALAMAACVFLAFAGIAGGVGWAVRDRGAREEALDRERRGAYFYRITLAHQDLAADNLGRALKLLEECPEGLRRWEWFYLRRLCRVEPLVLRDDQEMNSVAFSPDGERLASAGGDGAVKIWDSRTGAVLQTIPHAHAEAVVAVAFHPGGKYLASAGGDRRVKVWDLTTGRPVFAGPCNVLRKFGTTCAVAFHPDGRQLAAGDDGAVKVWDWQGGLLLHTFPGHEHHSVSVAFSRDGRRLATGSWLEGLRLWDPAAGGRPPFTLPGHRHPVSALAFSPDGGRLASASLDRSVKVWDTTTGALLHTLEHTGTVMGVAFSPDGRRLASAGEDRMVRVWDTQTGREVLGLRGHTDLCGCVAFSPDGRRLASAGADGTIRLWDATPLRGDEGQEALTFTRHRGEVRSAAFSPDGKWVASAGLGAPVQIWDAATGRVCAEFSGDTFVVFGLAWKPDGRRLAAAGSNGRQQTVKVWDVRDRQEVFALPAGREYFAVAFHPDGRHLVTGNLSGAVQVWDAGTGREVGTLGTHGREIRVVAFSRDGLHLATASPGGEVKLWDATRLHEKQTARLTLRARVPRPSSNVAFSPDGRRLATGGEQNTVTVWDVQTGQELRTLRGHNGEVYSVAFHPDGRWVASGGADGTVKVWDSDTGKSVRSFRGHTALVSTVAFSPDGRRLVSGSRDATVKVWDLTPLSKH
jgi:WD40 repeat protein/serine/threonine protein kinase